MKKTALIILLLTVSFLTCKKKSTEATNKEDKITAETAINYSDHKTDITMKIKAEGWDRKDFTIELDREEVS